MGTEDTKSTHPLVVYYVCVSAFCHCDKIPRRTNVEQKDLLGLTVPEVSALLLGPVACRPVARGCIVVSPGGGTRLLTF